jgi:hypothetical protein
MMAHRSNLTRFVMPGLVPGIHVLRRGQTWMAGTQASEATPCFARLLPAMTA